MAVLSLFNENPLEGGPPHCHRCGLLRQCKSPKMNPYGGGRKKILIVGEAPGEQEDECGRPFVGLAGKHLRSVLRALGLAMDRDCWATNSIICRPPHNKIRSEYADACRPALFRTIRELRPKGILLLGLWACRQLLNDLWPSGIDSMSQWRGWAFPRSDIGAWIGVAMHPSYVIRKDDRQVDNQFESDISRFVARCASPFPDSSMNVEPVLVEGDVTNRLRTLSESKGILAFDYETNRLKPEMPGSKIASIGCCLNGRNAWAGMISTDEQSKLVRRILLSPKIEKVAANAKFEDRWSRATFGCGVKPWRWDTMLAAHFLDNRKKICSLKFQSMVRFGVADYSRDIDHYLNSKDDSGFNRVFDAPRVMLLRYNAMDALMTYRLMKLQEVELSSWAA